MFCFTLNRVLSCNTDPLLHIREESPHVINNWVKMVQNQVSSDEAGADWSVSVFPFMVCNSSKNCKILNVS